MRLDLHKTSSVFTGLVICWTLLLSFDSASAQIRAGASYLKILPGTRQQTLANSITAGLDEPYALFANPAVTGFSREWEWSASYAEWIADVYNISIVHSRSVRMPSPFGNGIGAAIGFNYQGIRAFDATGGNQASAVASDMLVTGSFGVPMNHLIQGLSIGTNVKYFRSRLAQFDATSRIVDLGFLYRTRRYRLSDNRFFDNVIFSLGASSSQLGRPLRFISEETPLPRAWRTGMAINLGRHDGLQVQFSTNYTHARDEDGAFGFGFEVANALSPFTQDLGRLVSVRGGYNMNTDTDNPLIRQFVLGLSFRVDDYMSTRGANVTPRNTAFRFDLAMQDGQSVSNVYEGSAAFKTIRPEAFSIVQKPVAAEPGDSLVVAWERSNDPDLYDHVNYLVLVANADQERLDNVLSTLESYEIKVPEIIDVSAPDIDSVAVDLLYLSDTNNRRIASLYGPGEEDWPFSTTWRNQRRLGDSQVIRYPMPPRLLEGDYHLSVVAYDQNGHVRTVEDRAIPFHVDDLPISPDLTIDIRPKLNREPLEPVILTLNNVRFQPDSFRLSDKAKIVLRDWATILTEKYPDVSFEIAGHTDSTGPPPAVFRKMYNQRLSEKRARNVARFLVTSGVPPDRLVVKGYGESQPLLAADGTPLLAENRRVEVRVFEDDRQPPLKPMAEIVFANNTATARDFSVTVYDSDELSHVLENLELSGKSFAILNDGVTYHEQIYSERLKKWLVEMKPGDVDSIQIPWDLGRPMIAAEIDAEDKVIESNEANNWDLEKLSSTDLGLRVESEDLIVQSGDTLRYSLHIQNLGPYPADNVDLVVELPAALEVLGGVQIQPDKEDLQIVTCHFDHIDGSSGVNFDLQAIVPPVSPDSTMYIMANGRLDFSEDANLSNNTDSALACASLINFELDEFYLTSSAQQALMQIADFLNTRPFARYEVVGYADTTGQEQYNQVLSYKRASNVVRFLEGAGVCFELQPSGHGENNRYDTLLRNRRVEIRKRHNSGWWRAANE